MVGRARRLGDTRPVTPAARVWPLALCFEGGAGRRARISVGCPAVNASDLSITMSGRADWLDGICRHNVDLSAHVHFRALASDARLST